MRSNIRNGIALHNILGMRERFIRKKPLVEYSTNNKKMNSRSVVISAVVAFLIIVSRKVCIEYNKLVSVFCCVTKKCSQCTGHLLPQILEIVGV